MAPMLRYTELIGTVYDLRMSLTEDNIVVAEKQPISPLRPEDFLTRCSGHLKNSPRQFPITITTS